MKGVRLKAFGVALLGAFALLFAGCGQQGSGGGSAQAPTKGSLTVNVTPADAQVQVTGPNSYSDSFTGGKTLTNLEPGSYTVQASKTGYFPAQATHQVEAGKTTTVVLNLTPRARRQPYGGQGGGPGGERQRGAHLWGHGVRRDEQRHHGRPGPGGPHLHHRRRLSHQREQERLPG